jgi:hypothetical protein
MQKDHFQISAAQRPVLTAAPARSLGTVLLFAAVYAAALALIFAPQGSFSSPNPHIIAPH